jgi:6-phosphogluconolactonase (cycloisomerase 2 family)
VSSLRYDENGELQAVCTVSALPADCEDGPQVKQSDLQLHPNGRHLYTLIRGLDAVTVFAVDQDRGTLAPLQTVKLDCVGPRGCAISPDGRFMIVTGLEGQEVTIWRIAEDGTLHPTGRKVSLPNPGTATFFPPTVRGAS